MPASPNPTADLARMYRERIPTAPLSNYDKVIQSRLAPHRFTGGSSGLGFLAPVGNFLKTAVESLDPRFIASEGGRSVEHVYGDARELAKSVVTGEDTLSQSPSARAYQAAGGGFGGALAAALPYVNVATAVVPTTKLLTPAGRVAMGADAIERVAQRQLGQAISQVAPGVRPVSKSILETAAQPNPRVKYYFQTKLNGTTKIVGIDPASDKIVGTAVMVPDVERGQFVLDAMASEKPTAVLKLLSAADELARREFPDNPFPVVPSGDLSVHSRPLVERLMKAGLIDPTYRLPSRTNEITFVPDQAANWARVYDRETLVPIGEQELESSYKNIKSALARSRANQSLGIAGEPVRMTTPSQELARRQMIMSPEARADRLWQMGQVNSENALRGAEQLRRDVLDRATPLVGADEALRIADLYQNPPNSMAEELLGYASVEELILAPLERFIATTMDSYEATMLIDELTTEMAARLATVMPSTYDMGDELFLDAVWATIADLWQEYGGQIGRQLVDTLD